MAYLDVFICKQVSFSNFSLVVFIYNSGFCSFTSLGMCHTCIWLWIYDRDQIFFYPPNYCFNFIKLYLRTCYFCGPVLAFILSYCIYWYGILVLSNCLYLSPQSFCLGFGTLYFLLVIFHQLSTCLSTFFFKSFLR